MMSKKLEPESGEKVWNNSMLEKEALKKAYKTTLNLETVFELYKKGFYTDEKLPHENEKKDER